MDKLALILSQAVSDLNQVVKLAQLDQVKAKYLGKAGLISSYMQKLKDLPAEQRASFGASINRVKSEFESKLQQVKDSLIKAELDERLAVDAIDVGLASRGAGLGSLHPISICLNKMIDIFTPMGFNVAYGPEIETDIYNFEKLNFPYNHPARAMQDTFYTNNNYVLRTHTSPMQIRYVEAYLARLASSGVELIYPIKVLAPGRVYRVDMDATHSPMFHQLEGLWIDYGISFANLKAIMISFLRNFFANPDLKVRFRTSFFPFTEPSAEIDIMDSSGKWLEVAGCGMVHPEVLANMGVDSNKYTGFAFGIGIDRFTMLRYDINDLRIMFENDLDFLQQFKGVN